VEAVPPQVVLALPETTTPLGNVSVSGAFRVAAVVLALLKVIVRVEVPPAAASESSGSSWCLRIAGGFVSFAPQRIDGGESPIIKSPDWSEKTIR
jgi:hypothetical protein